MYFMETSAKESNNVEKLFMEIAHALIEVNFANLRKLCIIIYMGLQIHAVFL